MRNEDTITVYIADILRKRRNTWNIEPQETLLREGQPDMTVTETGKEPVVIEVKVDHRNSPNLDGEEQAKQRLGERLASFEEVKTAMALRVPYRFRQLRSAEIPDALRDADDFHYTLFSIDNLHPIDDPHRFPNSGWIRGNISDVATALRIGAIPISKVVQAAEDLEGGINEAALLLAAAVKTRPHIAETVEQILYQEAGEQTYRMAMLIITNAFVFQSALAGTPGMDTVPSLAQLQTVGEQLNVNQVLNAWAVIRQVNYRPIFDVAYRLTEEVLATDDRLVGQILYTLRDTTQKLIAQGLAQVHELAGIVFQRLIVDRRFIKANYTRPESVALLSALVLPDPPNPSPPVLSDPPNPPAGGRGLCTFPTVADFACGTGALLNGLYQRILGLHEQAGGNGKDIHQQMVENSLIGADIMPNASHLTASIIASTYPDVKIGKTRIHTMAYGTQRPDGKYAIGALDLLDDPEGTLPLGLINTEQVQGDDSQVALNPDLIGDDTEKPEFRHGEFDIIIDNPPFTRTGADTSSSNPDVPKTVFGDKDRDVAKAMKAALRNIKTSIAHSNAGLGSYFVDLADRMLKPPPSLPAGGGERGSTSLYPPTMGFVLPLTVLTSPDWQRVRDLWATTYHNVTVITIADAKTENCAFSADTNMAECLVVALKGRAENTGRGTFVCLHRRPDSHLEAIEIAKWIQRLRDIRKFEDPPIGGNPIKVGDEIVGSALNCPLEKVWGASRIKELALMQSAYHLANGCVWLPEQHDPLEVPICSVSEMATTSFDETMIKGAQGAFDIEDGCSETDLYPGLWHVNSDNQRAMVVAPDSHGIIRSNSWDKAQRILGRNSRIHQNIGLRFNANSLSVLFTEKPAIGIRLLPNVVFENPSYDYTFALWGNSTLGLLCYWMRCNRVHAGRGAIRLTLLRSMPTLDMRQLDQTALQNAERIFEEMKHKKMLPFNQMFEDRVRQELDRRLLSEVLGLSEATHPEVHTGLHQLRERLCAEPSIHGGKRSRVVL